MAAILIIIFLVGWIFVAAKISSFAASKISSDPRRVLIALAIFAVLLPLPVTDEIVGGMQFRRLCSKEAMHVATDSVPGESVSLSVSPKDKYGRPSGFMTGTMISIRFFDYSYTSIKTSHPVITYRAYQAGGGWLNKLVGYPEGDTPWIIPNPRCTPDGVEDIQKNYNVVN